MDANLKAKTPHRDLSIGNIILYRVPNQPVRVGDLIDWELGCKVDQAAVPDRVFVVSSGAFPSFKLQASGPN